MPVQSRLVGSFFLIGMLGLSLGKYCSFSLSVAKFIVQYVSVYVDSSILFVEMCIYVGGAYFRH